MTTTQATAEVFLTALRALPEAERHAVLAGLARDPELAEDLQDMLVVEQRRGEPSRTLDEALSDLDEAD